MVDTRLWAFKFKSFFMLGRVQFSSVAQSCPTLSDPMDCSPTGSSVHVMFQARVLEWGAIAFSKFCAKDYITTMYPA